MAIRMLSMAALLLVFSPKQIACLPGSSRVPSSSFAPQQTNTHNAFSTKSVVREASSYPLRVTSTTSQSLPNPAPVSSKGHVHWAPSGAVSSESSSSVQGAGSPPLCLSSLPVTGPSCMPKPPIPGLDRPPVPSEASTGATTVSGSSEHPSVPVPQVSITAGLPSLSSSPLPTFTIPPEGFYISSVTSLRSENTIITTLIDNHQTVLPVLHGKALYGLNVKGTYFHLPGISGGVNIPCLVGCGSNQAPLLVGGGSSEPPNTENDPDDDKDDEKHTTTTSLTASTSLPCTSASTETFFPESVLCAVISTSIKDFETTTTRCSTATKTTTIVGCDIMITKDTSTSTITPESTTEIPLTMEVYTVMPPSPMPTSTPTSTPVLSPALSPPLTYEISSAVPPSSLPGSALTPSSFPNLSTTESSGAVLPLSTTYSPVHESRTSLALGGLASSPVTPTPTLSPSVTCNPRGKPSLVCQCTESETNYFTLPALREMDNICGYTTNPSSTTSVTSPPPPTVTGYSWTDPVESIVKSCDTATVLSDRWEHTTCDDPVPVSTLHPRSGTATLHVWEAWETSAVSPTIILAAVMNDTDRVIVADKREGVEVALGKNISIPVTNLEDYPIKIEPVASVKFLDERKCRRSWSEKRMGVPSRPYPVDHSDLVFYVNGFTFNSVDDSEENKGRVLPYCSVGDWYFGSAADQLADFFSSMVPLAGLVLRAGELPNRQMDCYVMY